MGGVGLFTPSPNQMRSRSWAGCRTPSLTATTAGTALLVPDKSWEQRGNAGMETAPHHQALPTAGREQGGEEGGHGPWGSRVWGWGVTGLDLKWQGRWEKQAGTWGGAGKQGQTRSGVGWTWASVTAPPSPTLMGSWLLYNLITNNKCILLYQDRAVI